MTSTSRAHRAARMLLEAARRYTPRALTADLRHERLQARDVSNSYKIRQFRPQRSRAPLERLPCRPHALGGRSWSRARPLQRLSHRHGRTSPCGAPSRSSHMLHMHRTCRGGDHHRDATRCCSRAGPAPTAPLAVQSCLMMSSTLLPPAARRLDAAPMRCVCGLRQHARRRTRVSVGGSVGAMGGALLRSGHAYLTGAHRFVQRWRPNGHMQLWS